MVRRNVAKRSSKEESIPTTPLVNRRLRSSASFKASRAAISDSNLHCISNRLSEVSDRVVCIFSSFVLGYK